MTRLKRTLLTSFSILLLTACTSPESTEVEENTPEEETSNEHYLSQKERGEPVSAGISQSSHFGDISKDFFVEIEDEETLQFIIEDMIDNSTRVEGIADMAEPLYGMQMEYDDGSTETFHLWVAEGEASGTIMDASETHYIYTFSKNAVETFMSFIPEEYILN